MPAKYLHMVIISTLLLAIGNGYADGDATRGQELAEDCALCHGDDGLGDEEIPSLAGKGTAYIRLQLAAFKSGARVDQYEDMVDIAADLSDQDIDDLAAYYATQTGKQ